MFDALKTNDSAPPVDAFGGEGRPGKVFVAIFSTSGRRDPQRSVEQFLDQSAALIDRWRKLSTNPTRHRENGASNRVWSSTHIAEKRQGVQRIPNGFEKDVAARRRRLRIGILVRAGWRLPTGISSFFPSARCSGIFIGIGW